MEDYPRLLQVFGRHLPLDIPFLSVRHIRCSELGTCKLNEMPTPSPNLCIASRETQD